MSSGHTARDEERINVADRLDEMFAKGRHRTELEAHALNMASHWIRSSLAQSTVLTHSAMTEIEVEAARYAAMYPAGSDGRNTFNIFAEMVQRKIAALASGNGAVEAWRRSDYTEGPNPDGYYTAGIDTPQPDTFGNPDWHGHAIQFHHKDKAEAERRRDLVLRTPSPTMLDPVTVEAMRKALLDAQRIIERDFPNGQLAIDIRAALGGSLSSTVTTSEGEACAAEAEERRRVFGPFPWDGGDK